MNIGVRLLQKLTRNFFYDHFEVISNVNWTDQHL